MAKKKKSAPKKRTPAKKKTPAKRKPAKRSSAKRTPRKRAKNKPEKKKEKKKGGIVSRVIDKIPTSYKVKGGKSKYKSKYGESEVEYEEVKVGK